MRVLLALPVLLAACGTRAPDEPTRPEPSPPPTREARDVDTLEERIVELVAGPDGAVHVGFERSSRWYRIDPVRSPEPDRLRERARRALDSGAPVRATIDFTGTRIPKGSPDARAAAIAPVLLELEDARAD